MHVAKLDSADGEWDLAPAMVEDVAVIPRDRGEYTVYLRLPAEVAQSGEMWGTILQKAVTKLQRRNCAIGASQAYEFYRRVFDELTSYGH